MVQITPARAALLKAKVDRLIDQHGVFKKDVLGAYTDQPLRSLEYLFHEVAHWIVLGNSIEKLPQRLSRRLSEQFETIPMAASDALEIDTSLVCFLAGQQLRLWDDPEPIARCCRRNLRGPWTFGEDRKVVELFRERIAQSNSYVKLAKKLALWFQPSAKLNSQADEPLI